SESGDLAEVALRGAPDDPFALFLAALADHRAGRHGSSLDRLRRGRSARFPDSFDAPIFPAWTKFLEALGLAALGRLDEARGALELGRRAQRERNPSWGTGETGSLTEDISRWVDIILLDALAAEAEAVVVLDPAFPRGHPFANEFPK